ncbi:GGDEF domain-containing protein [Pseudonocardia xinjiangensis]|uniref:sensor domain-containing diguanylate cyclase n=1 Tax=Pseudonocardia xinjiangensis TaxID=75289 RepID=UPI003D905CBD
MRLPRRRPGGLTRWDVWSSPAPVLTIILIVELVAVGTLAASLRHGVGPLPSSWLLTLAVLVGAGIVSTEASLGVERVRRQSDETPHIDLSSVWTFAAAALLPAPLAVAVAVLIYSHIYARVWRRSGVPPHRALFSAATVVLAVEAAAAVMRLSEPTALFRTVGGLLTVLAALLVYAAVNMVLVVGVIVLSGPNRRFKCFLQVLAHGDDAVLEFATLSMGALAACAMASFGAAYALLVLPPLIVLHRTVLVRQLEEAASTDGKTGLLNAAAWHTQAGQALRRIEREGAHATVLVLDLDHFKQVNDQYGHLVGDQVLAAVAEAVRAEVREGDLVGRFGGEEFVVLLPGLDGEEGHPGAEAVAERIRRRIRGLRVDIAAPVGQEVIDHLSVSIGGAMMPVDGTELTQLLEVADAAMYCAKHAGRNTVRMGLTGFPGPVGGHRPRRSPPRHP